MFTEYSHIFSPMRQDKRVTVSIQYSGESGLKPYYLTVAKKIKKAHPDVIIERKILPSYGGEMEEPNFEIFVDGKIGKFCFALCYCE